MKEQKNMNATKNDFVVKIEEKDEKGFDISKDDFGKKQKDEIVAEIKMSKSSPDSCIYIHDSEEEIKRKIKKAFCPEKVVNGNPIIDICKYIIFPELESWKFGNEENSKDLQKNIIDKEDEKIGIKKEENSKDLQKNFVSGEEEKFGIKNKSFSNEDLQKSFIIERPEKFGGNVVLNSFEDLEKQFSDGKIHPLDLKSAVAKYLNNSLISVREYFAKHPENYEKMKKMKITR